MSKSNLVKKLIKIIKKLFEVIGKIILTKINKIIGQILKFIRMNILL
jgi:hypothetical protein